jgi:hypothetical protein
MRARLAALVAVLSLLFGACYLAPNPGASGPRWTTPDAGTNIRGWNGDASFRISCARSHYGKADPIVSPGVEAMHEHVFFGNTGINKDSTATSIATTGNSTCEGGTINRTGYWVPAMYDTAANNAVLDAGPIEDALQVYYKSGYKGAHSAVVQQFPEGLRMVAGDTQTRPDETYWDCIRTPNAQDVIPHPTETYTRWDGVVLPKERFQYIPDHCGPGDFVQLTVEFPQCWDGENLDSPDHRSHMAYGTWQELDPLDEDGGCPASHPVVLMQITEHVRWMIPVQGTPKVPHHADCVALGWSFNPYASQPFGDPSTWPTATDPDCALWTNQPESGNLVLSSDAMMGHGLPGDSAHADWFMGWDLAVLDRVLNGCFHVVMGNCEMGLVPFPIGQSPIANPHTQHGFDWAKLGAPTP